MRFTRTAVACTDPGAFPLAPLSFGKTQRHAALRPFVHTFARPAARASRAVPDLWRRRSCSGARSRPSAAVRFAADGHAAEHGRAHLSAASLALPRMRAGADRL